jgi:hypothetical protein
MNLTMTDVERRLLAHALWRSSGREPTCGEVTALIAWAEQSPLDWATRARHIEAVRGVLYGGAPVYVTDDGQVLADPVVASARTA